MVAKRSKIELQGLSERVIEMYNKEQMTCTDIAAVLVDEGWDVSRVGVHREVKKWEDFLKEQKERDRFAKQFLDEFRERPNTDISEMTLQIVQSQLLDVVKNYDINSDSFGDVTKLVNAIARISDSQVNLDRLKTAFQKGVQAAKQELEDEFTALLENEHPDLLLKILDIIERAHIDSDGRKRKRRR
ncbi:phage protein Gp27 family protein [Vibrio campbellii]|uniref:phage protein Gp27 family protein n=1 Tax=Vibrio campbellii TaxID=680 RepID=UPI001F1C7885|nr:phage protein Gp27 family protein [Vibrio campbellii]MCE7729630.1 DUF3486 family protein [Vibrio campbellii]